MSKVLKKFILNIRNKEKNNEVDKKVSITLRIISYYILLFLLQGIFTTYLRHYQFRRNMNLIEPFLTVDKVKLMESLGELQYLESVIVLCIFFIISIIGLYYFLFKVGKEEEENKKNNE